MDKLVDMGKQVGGIMVKNDLWVAFILRRSDAWAAGWGQRRRDNHGLARGRWQESEGIGGVGMSSSTGQCSLARWVEVWGVEGSSCGEGRRDMVILLFMGGGGGESVCEGGGGLDAHVGSGRPISRIERGCGWWQMA